MADQQRRINQRKGHRGVVTKIIAKVNDAIQGESSETRETRELIHAHKISLVEKLDVLQKLDDEIGEHLDDEAEIETEIEQCGDVRHNIHHCITKIESFINETVEPGIQDPPDQKPVRYKSAMLGKLKISEFSGNPMEFQSFWDCFDAACHRHLGSV